MQILSELGGPDSYRDGTNFFKLKQGQNVIETNGHLLPLAP
jgi:hypothetical protein